MRVAPLGLRLLAPLLFLALAAPASAQFVTRVWVHDLTGLLATVDVDSGQVAIVGDMGEVLTDIAFAPDGRLFGLDFTNLYEIDPQTGQLGLVGPHGIPNGNALVFGADGTLYGMGNVTASLYEIDPTTGAAASQGVVGVPSAGDLAFFGGELYLAGADSHLWHVGLGPVGGSDVGAFGFPSVFGLATSEAGVLYGVSGVQVFAVDVPTGAGMLLSSYGGQGLDESYGSSFLGEAFHACPLAPVAGCVEVPSAKLTWKGKAAGREKLSLAMKSFAAPTAQSDFGDPVGGATRYEICLYDQLDRLAGGLGVSRAGDGCGPKGKPCWKAKKDTGWSYKNPDTVPSGIKKLLLASGPVGKGKIAVKAGNSAKKLQTNLPGGIGAALAGASAVTVQVKVDPADPGTCFEARLTTIKKAEPALFQGRAP